VKTLDLVDFSKGFNTRDVGDLMDYRELQTAENCRWQKSGLIQRGGISVYTTTALSSGDVVRGVSERIYLNSDWYDILAIDVSADSEVRFYYRQTITPTLLSESVVFTTGYSVYFAELNGYIVATNGVDMPIVIYYNAGWQIKTLEEHDVRTWLNETWNAGQYDDSGPTYTDDTTDAQDTGAGDFQLGNTTENDGFWISCSHPFTKITFHSAEQAGGAPVASYQYWNGSAWTTLTLTTTPTWTDAAGDRTMEWDYLSGMATYSGEVSGLSAYYVIRVRFTTAASADFSCDYITVQHSHYISEMTGGGVPKMCASFGNRMFLSEGYIAYFSPPNRVTGWRGVSESEYFLEGGPEIRAMIRSSDSLVVFKDAATYSFYGNALSSFFRTQVSVHGIIEPRACVATEVGVFYLSSDGIRIQTGKADVLVSKHIQDTIDSLTTTGAVATYYDGVCYMAFPLSSICLVWDPMSLNIEDTGDGKVAFYKYTNHNVSFFMPCARTGDERELHAIVGNTGGTPVPYIAEMESGTNDTDRADAAVSIAFKIQTGYLSLGSLLKKKIFNRIKVKLKKAASAGSYTLTVYSDNGDRNVNTTIATAAGSGNHVNDSRLPYSMDGYNMSVKIESSSGFDAGLAGLSIEYESRVF
jgi:hypothetical protein